ncbi:MAG: CRTAC1 family protein [Meiothermus sp.]|nr:CRTAC1 family protein [Meiothermus sp.]
MFKIWNTSSLFGCALIIGLTLAQGTPAPAPAVPSFVDETASVGLGPKFLGDYVVGGGVATFDCDGNGLPEIYLSGGTNKAKFYRNLSAVGGALRFREETSGLELEKVMGAYPLDIDNDGLTDLAILRDGGNVLMRGLPGCRFENANRRWNFGGGRAWTTAFAATWERGQAMPSLAWGNYTEMNSRYPWGTCKGNALFRPSGNQYGAATSLEPSFCALSMQFTDWNRSSVPSLRVSNDREYYEGKGREQLWQVLPGQAPREYTEADGFRRLQIWGMGIASYDLLGTGYPVYYLTSMGDNKLQSLISTQSPLRPTYQDIAFRRNATAHRPYTGGDVHMSTAWHVQFDDANNDGLIDLFVAKGNVGFMRGAAAKDPNNLMLGQPDGSFTEVGDRAGVASMLRGRGAQMVDFNADGLLDLVVVNRLDNPQLWRNLGSGTPLAARPMGNWVQVRLAQTGNNRDAIGSWFEVQLPSGRVLRRELTVGGGHVSGNLGWTHFGLGSAERVRIRVQWPDGAWGEWLEAPANSFYLLDRATGLKPFTPQSSAP